MIISDSMDELSWLQRLQPTAEELYQSGGLHVEDWPHARQVMRLSIQMFEETQPLHRLNERALHLLERAAFLHNAGMLVDTRRHHKHSFRVINETKLPGFTDEERYEIACIARYHRRALPTIEHKEYAALSTGVRKRVSALAALLRVADAFDYNHDGRVLLLKADPALSKEGTWTLQVWVRLLADLDTELEHAYEKADLFEKVFKRKLRFVVQDEDPASS